MLLSIYERLMLLSILPKEGSITTIRIVRELRESLSFTSDEHTLYSIDIKVNEDGTSNITWKDKPETGGEWEPVEIDISKKAHEVIMETFEKMSTNKQFTESHLDLYGKFKEG